MYCPGQEREELENELYQDNEDNSEASDANSELEFHLYSQLHYSSNAGEMDEMEDNGDQVEKRSEQHLQGTEGTAKGDEKLELTGESEPPSPDVAKLHQHLKKKKKNGENHKTKKRQKSDLKGQRLTSLMEEVIVIDSSPDVISISEDDTEDEEGICALKGKDLRQLQTSTPAQQGNLKRKGTFNTPVSVDSSSSDSESEDSESNPQYDSSDSSDSDGLENWMILGRGQQDGDQSISLNLEGGSDSSADAKEEESGWLVSDKDKEAQIYNKDKGARISVQRVLSRYYTSKSVLCRNCNKTGHLSKNCPEPKKLSPCFLCGTPGHLVSECPNKHCNNCGHPGHLYSTCSEKAYWHKQCHRCGMKGHYFDACPEIWRQFHLTTKTGIPVMPQREDRGRSPAFCYNCSRKGHFGHACTQHRMFNGVYPSTPFINHYDTMQDINRRQHRIKLKVKELKKNDCFPTTCETPSTPGPAKKRQKVSHHKSSYQSNHTPRQTFNNHKPSPSHLFFTDDDFNDVTPKINKFNKFRERESTGKVKPWKPKRPLPNSRDKLPPNKLIYDESADFPRGGGTGQNLERKKKEKNKNKKGAYSRPDRVCWTVSGESKHNGEKKKKKKNRAQRTGAAKSDAQMYPTDENLFIIKQKKRKR